MKETNRIEALEFKVANDDSAGNHDGTIGSTVTLNQPGITGDGPAFAFVNDTTTATWRWPTIPT